MAKSKIVTDGVYVIDKLRVAGVMKNKHRGVSRGVYFP